MCYIRDCSRGYDVQIIDQLLYHAFRKEAKSDIRLPWLLLGKFLPVNNKHNRFFDGFRVASCSEKSSKNELVIFRRVLEESLRSQSPLSENSEETHSPSTSRLSRLWRTENIASFRRHFAFHSAGRYRMTVAPLPSYPPTQAVHGPVIFPLILFRLCPTRAYLPPLLKVLECVHVHAHISIFASAYGSRRKCLFILCGNAEKEPETETRESINSVCYCRDFTISLENTFMYERCVHVKTN